MPSGSLKRVIAISSSSASASASASAIVAQIAIGVDFPVEGP